MFRTVIVTILLVVTAPAFAKLYKCEGPDGSVSYTDEPCAGGKELKLPPLQTFTPVKVPERPANAGAPDDKSKAFSYKSFKIVKPLNDKPIESTAGNVQIALEIKPGLNSSKGHKISIALDGEPLATTGSTTLIKLSNVDRGSHTVQAFIQDKNGRVIKTSNSVTFHLKRNSVLFPQGPAGQTKPTVPGPSFATPR